MKCRSCKTKNLHEALFCENCGAPIKNKRYLPLILCVAAVCVILLIGIFVSTKFFSPYDRYVDKGYKLMDKGDIQGAVEAFDEAIRLNAKRPKAFVGKIKAYSKTDDENTADNISDTAKEGYEKTESEEIVDAVEEVEKELLGAGRGAVAYEMLKNLEGVEGFGRFQESIRAKEEEIISKYKELLKEYNGASSYSIYDIDKNGIPEIIMSSLYLGDDEAVHTISVHTIENDSVVEVGKLPDKLQPVLTVPDKNGLLGVPRGKAEMIMITLVGGTLKYESTINEEGIIVIDGQETGVQIEEIYQEEFNCEEIIKGSQGFNYFSNDETLYLDTYFKNYDSMKEAAKDIISLTSETQTHYAIFDVDKDGYEEIILINKYREQDYYTELYYEAMYYEVLGLLNEKVYWRWGQETTGIYECEQKGIVCKDIYDRYELYYVSPNNMYGGRVEEFAPEEVSYLKEIPLYPINDLSAIESLE